MSRNVEVPGRSTISCPLWHVEVECVPAPILVERVLVVLRTRQVVISELHYIAPRAADAALLTLTVEGSREVIEQGMLFTERVIGVLGTRMWPQ